MDARFKIFPCFRASISGSASRVKLVNATMFSICMRSNTGVVDQNIDP
jgi:hypothetical protein